MNRNLICMGKGDHTCKQTLEGEGARDLVVRWSAFRRLQKLAFAALLLSGLSATACQALEVKLGYLHSLRRPATISLVQMPAADDGVAGAELAVRDNNTSGRFLGEQFTLADVHLSGDQEAVAAIGKLADAGVYLIIADLPADTLLKVADAGKARGLLIFNVAAIDDRLRQEDCRANVVHSAPSRAMLADGLALYLAW